jgi:hypothetical protein
MTGSGTVIATLAGGVAADAAGNPSDASTSTDNVVTFDNTAASTLSFTRQNPASSPTNADTLVFRASFSEEVVGVDAADFAVGGSSATISGVAVVGDSGGTEYDVTVSGGDLASLNGTVELNFAGTVTIDDTAGNPLPGTEPSIDEAYVLDNTSPTVTVEQAAGQADPTGASPINFTVVFSEDVDDFVTGDVSLSGTAGATTQLVTGSGTTYNVAVSGMTGDGTVIASIAAGVASDAAGNLNQASTSTDNEVTYDTTPPVVSNVQASPNPSDGTGNVVLTATATDALTKVTSAEYNIDGGGFSPMAASDGGFDELAEDVTVTISAATLAEGSRTLCVRATDEATNRSGDAAACTTLIVDRTPPAISNFAVSPNPVAVNTPFTISATFTDALTNVTDAQYSLGGTGGPWVILPNAGGSYDSQTENGSITLSLPNADVLDVCVRSTDQVGNTNQPAPGTNPIQCIFLAVYDPTAGFVTGGGWIDSPSSACPIFCSGAVGKATFGFVSKYITQKDKTTPVLTGNTEFQFHAGNVNFKSTNYEWLVVSGNGTRAQYKGTGTMNGQAGYGFLLTALESPDRFRMKIWDATGTIYDNQWEKADSGNDATLLGGGSIIIHVPKK